MYAGVAASISRPLVEAKNNMNTVTPIASTVKSESATSIKLIAPSKDAAIANNNGADMSALTSVALAQAHEQEQNPTTIAETKEVYVATQQQNQHKQQQQTPLVTPRATAIKTTTPPTIEPVVTAVAASQAVAVPAAPLRAQALKQEAMMMDSTEQEQELPVPCTTKDSEKSNSVSEPATAATLPLASIPAPTTAPPALNGIETNPASKRARNETTTSRTTSDAMVDPLFEAATTSTTSDSATSPLIAGVEGSIDPLSLPANSKKRRFTWSEDLHRQFIASIFNIGLLHSSPKAIIEDMPEIPGHLTTEHVKSHLQKFRTNTKRARELFLSQYDICKNQNMNNGTNSVRSGRTVRSKVQNPSFHLYPIPLTHSPNMNALSIPPQGHIGDNGMHFNSYNPAQFAGGRHAAEFQFAQQSGMTSGMDMNAMMHVPMGMNGYPMMPGQVGVAGGMTNANMYMHQHMFNPQAHAHAEAHSARLMQQQNGGPQQQGGLNPTARSTANNPQYARAMAARAMHDQQLQQQKLYQQQQQQQQYQQYFKQMNAQHMNAQHQHPQQQAGMTTHPHLMNGHAPMPHQQHATGLPHHHHQQQHPPPPHLGMSTVPLPNHLASTTTTAAPNAFVPTSTSTASSGSIAAYNQATTQPQQPTAVSGIGAPGVQVSSIAVAQLSAASQSI